MSTPYINPWIRRYNYISDYFWNVYRYYVETYNAFPVTYYSTDHENTIWEDEYLNAGTYENRGVGELSGQLWKRIHMLPVFALDPMVPTQESSERGVQYEESMRTKIAFPSIYGLRPFEDDAVDLSFGFKNPGYNSKQIFTINKVDHSHIGDYLQFYTCQLKVANYTKDMIEKQISTDWLFYEHEKTILPVDNAKLLLLLQENSLKITDQINDNFNKTGFYLYDPTSSPTLINLPKILTAHFSGDYPGTQTELKENDEFHFSIIADRPIVKVEFDGSSGYATKDMEFSISSKSSFTFKVKIANRGNITQDLPARFRVQDSADRWSKWFVTNSNGNEDGVNTVKLNNIRPIIGIGVIEYPNNQYAIKNDEMAVINNSISYFDSVEYSSPNNQLIIHNPTTYSENKIVMIDNVNYNVDQNNFKIFAKRNANDSTSSSETIVFIVNNAASITADVPFERLRSGGNDGTEVQEYTITFTSDQFLYEPPNIDAPVGTWKESKFIGGPYIWTRTLQIHDDDTKGTFSWQISNINMSGLSTDNLSGGSTYTIGGFVSRELPLEAFLNETTMNVAATNYDKVLIDWEVKPLPNKRPIGTVTEVPILNGWCLESLDTNPTIVRILDIYATEATSQETTVTIEETI